MSRSNSSSARGAGSYGLWGGPPLPGATSKPLSSAHSRDGPERDQHRDRRTRSTDSPPRGSHRHEERHCRHDDGDRHHQHGRRGDDRGDRRDRERRDERGGAQERQRSSGRGAPAAGGRRCVAERSRSRRGSGEQRREHRDRERDRDRECDRDRERDRDRRDRLHRDRDPREREQRERERERQEAERAREREDRARHKEEQERRRQRREQLHEAKRKLTNAVKDCERRNALDAALTMIEMEDHPPQELLRGMLENAAARPGPDLFAKTLQCCVLGKLRLEPQHFAKLVGSMLSRETAHAQIRAVLNMALPQGSKPIPLVNEDMPYEEMRAAFQDSEVRALDGEDGVVGSDVEGGDDEMDWQASAGEGQPDANEESPFVLQMRDCEVLPMLNGEYTLSDPEPEVLGHERPTYVRLADGVTTERDICIYYSEGDSESDWMAGWWVSYDEIAGDEVIAYNPADTWAPPARRWQVLSEDGQRHFEPNAVLLPTGMESKQTTVRTPEEAEEALSTIDLASLAGCLTAKKPELAAYFGHFVALLHLEHLAEIGQHRRRMLRMRPERLVRFGWAMTDLECNATYGRRESKKGTLPGWPDRGAEFAVFRNPLCADDDRLRIKRGDSVIISHTDPMHDRIAEGNIVEISSKKIVVNVGSKMPRDLRRARFRVDAYVNRAVYERQMAALLQLANTDRLDPLLEILISAEVGKLDTWAERATAPPWRQRALLHNQTQEDAERREAAKTSRCAKLAAEVPRSLEMRVEDAKTSANAILDLNDSQKNAVQEAMVRRCTIVQGPPGTGKTHVSVKVIAGWVKTLGVKPLLATSDSNVAVDNIAEGLYLAGVKVARVGRPEKVRGHLEEITLESMFDREKERKMQAEEERRRAQEEEEEERRAAEEEDYMDEGFDIADDGLELEGEFDYEADAQAERESIHDEHSDAEIERKSDKGRGKVGKGKAKGKDLDREHDRKRQQRREDFEMRMAILSDVDVICATTISAGSDFLSRFNFHGILIDEVAQSTEASSIVPIVTRGAKQLVLVGDHCQLPPAVISREAELRGYSLSVYSRLMDGGIEPHFLDTQYRSHPRIVEFSARCFYQGALRSGVRGSSRPPLAGIPWPNPNVPVAFFEVGEEESVEGESKANHAEAERIKDLLLDVLDQGELTLSDIGVVTPYMAQVRLLRRSLRQALPQDTVARDLEIASVDNFQGREKELIIFSAVRSNRRGNVGFLADWRRLNVMLTRARRGLVVFGAARTLRNDCHWQQWLEWCYNLKAMGRCIESEPQVSPAPWGSGAARGRGAAVRGAAVRRAVGRGAVGRGRGLARGRGLRAVPKVMPKVKAKVKAPRANAFGAASALRWVGSATKAVRGVTSGSSTAPWRRVTGLARPVSGRPIGAKAAAPARLAPKAKPKARQKAGW
eukprot:TRINITY_DN9638_c0_g1_i1.p1 TRINITY_DN9638_c0_g1~~TRINITY_DN9638_c0_g1_i1.p1  ORF type:complete len:1408 (-),score=265.01 TRINITY_DN9638_c0_g1_i1:59-4282(-)